MPTPAHDYVENLTAYETGKPIEELAREMGLAPGDIVKLASNENPLGPSPLGLAALHAALTQTHRYPDGGGWALRTAIAEQTGLALENVVLGNGSNEIIELLAHAFLDPTTEIIAPRHAFICYKLAAQLFGATTIETADPDYRADLDAILAAITPRTRLVFFANPNNPTGTLVGQAEIDAFMDRVPDDVTVVFDEAYFEYLDSPPDVLKFIRAGRNAIVLRTFSKIHGLAALRVGYSLAPARLSGLLQKTRQPFNVNSLAQTAALAALHDTAHLDRTRALTHDGRAYLENEFATLGLEYVPSFASFVLVNVGDGPAIFQALLTRGVIVRPMGGYGLPAWLRVSVGTMDENYRFIAELKKLVDA
jgi:histidinol-phosphate aminotransferase